MHARFDSSPLIKSELGPSLRVRSDTASIHVQRDDGKTYMHLVSSFLSRFCIYPDRIGALAIHNLNNAFNDVFYAEIFNFFSNAHCIEILGTTIQRGNSARGFMKFLGGEAESAEQLGGVVALASIKTLIFDDVQFNPSNFKQLSAFLEHRKGRGEEISFVRLNHCAGIGVKRRMDLEQLVTSVQIVGFDDLDEAPVDGLPG